MRLIIDYSSRLHHNHQEEVESDAMLPLLPYCVANAGRVESMHMIRKSQVKRLGGRDAVGQAKFVEGLFQIAA